MRYNRLGQSGLVVSRMCFGAGSLGVGETLPGLIKNIDANAATEIVAKAIDAGINFFDTSDKYVDGHSEETLGKALGTKRKDVIVATKCGLPVGPTPNDRGLSAHHIIRSCERSLRRRQNCLRPTVVTRWPGSTWPVKSTAFVQDTPSRPTLEMNSTSPSSCAAMAI